MSSNVKTHLVIQTAFIGDVFLSIPFLQRLKSLFPQDKIIYIAKKGVADYLLKMHYIDQLMVVEKGSADSYNKIRNILKSIEIETVFCLHKSFRSAFFSYRIKAKNKFGFKKGLNSVFFSQSIKYPKSFPDVIRQMSLLCFVDPVLATQISSKDWSFLNQKNQQNQFSKIPSIFSFKTENKIKNKNNLALFPGSVWATKKWPLEKYIELANQLVAKGYSVFLMGGPDERTLCEMILKDVPECVNKAGSLSLIESIEFLKSCQLVIGNDSSSSHMAASVGTKVLAIFGPTTLDLGFRPWINGAAVIENLDLKCRPCGAHGPMVCPLGHHKCMKDISVEQVFNQALECLAI